MDQDEIIHRAVETALQRLLPTLVATVAADVKRQLDADLAGMQTYHRKRRQIDEEIASKFDGRNARQLARDLGVNRSTIYRALKKRRERSSDR